MPKNSDLCRDVNCNAPATHTLRDEHDRPVPGCKYCEKCANEIIAEFASRLKMYWTKVAL